jgi:hypothetical protein
MEERGLGMRTVDSKPTRSFTDVTRLRLRLSEELPASAGSLERTISTAFSPSSASSQRWPLERSSLDSIWGEGRGGREQDSG